MGMGHESKAYEISIFSDWGKKYPKKTAMT
jgi:hypothetical protein